MALPLIPLLAGAALLGGGTMIVKRLRRDPKLVVAAVQSKQVKEKWVALGSEKGLGLPVGPMYASPSFGGVALQGFKARNGDRSTIYANEKGTFAVKGAFFNVYTGNERDYGLPLSDEYVTKVSAAKVLGVKPTLGAVQQDFQNGKMVWLQNKKQLLGYVKGKLVYNSQPRRKEKAWYENIGVGDVLMATLAPTVLLNVGIGAVVGPEMQKGLLSKIPVIGPIVGDGMYELQRATNTYTCKAGGAVNEATGTGAEGVNGLCKAYMKTQGAPNAKDALAAGTKAAKGAASGGSSEGGGVAGIPRGTVAEYLAGVPVTRLWVQ